MTKTKNFIVARTKITHWPPEIFLSWVIILALIFPSSPHCRILLSTENFKIYYFSLFQKALISCHHLHSPTAWLQTVFCHLLEFLHSILGRMNYVMDFSKNDHPLLSLGFCSNITLIVLDHSTWYNSSLSPEFPFHNTHLCISLKHLLHCIIIYLVCLEFPLMKIFNYWE